MTDTREAAKGKWRGILTHFGVHESFLKNIHGPCPLCSGSDRFRWDDDEGSGSYFCNQCGAGSGLRLLMELKGWTFQEAAKRVDSMVGNIASTETKKKAEDKPAIMRKIYLESKRVTLGDPVWQYLESRCGDPGGYLENIRFHPGLKHPEGGTHPAMLALMWPNGAVKASGIHRTFLTPEGRKANLNPVRMSYGELAPVPLGPLTERLGIAEGIETAICASKRFDLPVWAAISAGSMKAWTPPEGVKSVVIFGDNDRNFTGQDAAYSLARRLSLAGLVAEVRIPETIGSDWADSHQQAAA